MDRTIGIMTEAAHAGGAVLKKYFGQQLAVTEKSTVADFQTVADLESEKAIVAVLRRAFPRYGIRAEETTNEDTGAEFNFIIDPLDSTNNFVIGLPYFSVALALQQRKETLISMVYDPILDIVYRAARGQGAYVNDERMRVSGQDEMARATIAYETTFVHSKELNATILERFHVVEKTRRFLISWSPSLDFCLLASGKIDGVITTGIDVYDFVPGKLIAREAGAAITDWQGVKDSGDENNKFIAVASPTLGKDMAEVLKKL